MSTLGKVLVFVNLFVGIALLSWSVSAYGHRLDWLDRKSGTESVKGEITKLKEEVDRLTKAAADAQATYGLRAGNLVRVEANRDTRSRKYQARLAQARAGQGFRVQLPLALPVWLTGIRQAAVMLVGVAAVAALIGAGGLGTYVFKGLQSAATDLILLGAIPATLLAVLIDAGLRGVEQVLGQRLGRVEAAHD